ncbi:hypothetical protein DINM_001296 [Dirofilaria immitis]|nr:hypothetical protein [Dirofilaria immitis]
MVINEEDNDAQTSLIKSDNIDNIKNLNFYLNSELREMVATEDERNSKKANDNSQLIVSNYAYDKLDQLAYQQQYFWSWQVILTFLIIILIINALIVLCLMKPESADKMTPISRFVPLNDFRKRTLATFNLRRPLLSIDSNNNLLILSSFENHTDELLVEQLPLDDFQNGFITSFAMNLVLTMLFFRVGGGGNNTQYSFPTSSLKHILRNEFGAYDALLPRRWRRIVVQFCDYKKIAPLLAYGIDTTDE